MTAAHADGWTVTHTFDYADAASEVVAQKVRIQNGDGGKEFRPRSRVHDPHAAPGAFLADGVWWRSGLADEHKALLYRLPEVLRAVEDGTERVYWCEGERDADTLAGLGHVATTAITTGGAHWSGQAEHLRGYGGAVVVATDSGDAGAYLAQQRLTALDALTVSAVAVAAVEGKDVRDHVEAGHGVEALVEVSRADIAHRAKRYDPKRGGDGYPGAGRVQRSFQRLPDGGTVMRVRFGDADVADTIDDDPTPTAGEGGTFFDVGRFLAQGMPPPPDPDVSPREDGACLFYAGYVNGLFGLPESGKTWIALSALARCLMDGGSGAFLDLDHNGPRIVIERLLGLGCSAEALSDPARFRYLEPDDAAHLRTAVTDLVDACPDVVVVDSVGELLPMLAMSSNSSDDFTEANRTILKPLAMAGACVLTIDHLNKDRETHIAGPTGTQAKVRAVGGAMYKVTATRPFVRGVGGSAQIVNTKDRPGGVLPNCEVINNVRHAGTFLLSTEDGERLRASISPPKTEEQVESLQDDRARQVARIVREWDGGRPGPSAVEIERVLFRNPSAKRAGKGTAEAIRRAEVAEWVSASLDPTNRSRKIHMRGATDPPLRRIVISSAARQSAGEVDE